MDRQPFYTSVTRIGDLQERPYEVEILPRDAWEDTDYVTGRVIGAPSALYRVELASGRLIDVMEGDQIIGALGRRTATLEAVGDWRDMHEDGVMHALTGAGLFGRVTSKAPMLPPLMALQYEGHLMRDGHKLGMGDFVKPVTEVAFDIPTILLVGTSMSAGKTTAGRVIIHALQNAGLRVCGAKFTGAGRYRDVLSFKDAGAGAIIDFVDAGLPSTLVDPPRFRDAMRYMLSRVQATGADVLVAEAGASPLEPYNGDIVVEMIGSRLCCTVLAASDPYAVVGVRQAFALEPDLVSGPAANTEAAVHLVRKLTGVPALNLLRASHKPALMKFLRQRLPDLL